MASEPYFDKAKGRWRMKWWSGSKRGWLTVTLCRHPGAWSKDRPPKRPPPEAQILAQKYRDLETQARHGVSVAPARAHDLRAYLGSYRERFARSKAAGSLAGLDRSIRLFLEHCDRENVTTVEAVAPKTCRDYLHWRHETVGHATLKTEKGLLSHAWTEARLDGVVSDNPWAAARVPGKANTDPPPYWTREELGRLADACRGWVRDFVLVAANTGIRVGAILSLEWRDVDFGRGVIAVRGGTNKGGRGYQVPVSATAGEVLARRFAARRDGVPLVFPGPRSGRRMRISDPYDRIGKAVRRAGLPDKGHHCHILRHTFATHAVAAGVPLLTVSAWLGHSSTKMTERYAHVIPSESHRQMGRFDLPPSAGGTAP